MPKLRRGRGDDTLYARAKPQKVELTETYSVEQEISANPSVQQVGDGVGRIEITVPYDGYEYFNRQAVADVEHATGPGGVAGDQRATIGHLLLADHTRTSGLRAIMRPHNQVGVVPVTVALAAPGGGLQLAGDLQSSVTTYDYQPDAPSIHPIDIDIDLYDFDSAGEFDTMQALITHDPDNPSWAIDKLRQEATFSSELLLRMEVRISVPVKAELPPLKAVVKNMSVEWPTLTSLSSTRLYIQNGGQITPAPVRYNPVKARLEWSNVRMLEERSDGSVATETRIFTSPYVWLLVGHPGDLFKEEKLEVNARVEVASSLLSGLEARLFDAIGHSQAVQPKLTTKLNIRTQVYPADIFAGREFSPYQQFVFDDIIPTEMRVTDIINVLRASGFVVEPPPHPQPDLAAPTWLLTARRSQGPDNLVIRVAVEGRRTVMDREELVTGTTKVTEGRESGQIKVSVMATLPRDHRELTREMNALQQGVRERFRFHQATRGGTGS